MPKFKRYDIKKLLANPNLRRHLVVEGTIATQAREGIDITREQAENSYYVVTEGERAAFFGLVPFRSQAGENDGRHLEFITTLSNFRSPVRADVALGDFAVIDGAPLAYDRLALVGALFRENPKLEPAHANAAQGLVTADDSQFVRCWWEVPKESQHETPRWRPFAKGGSYSRFYADVYLVVLWTSESISRMEQSGRVQNTGFYFRAGLTWPLRTQRGFNIRKMPEGCVFGHKGPAVIPKNERDTDYLLAVLNSRLVEYMLRCFSSFGSWEVGAIKKIPVPQVSSSDIEALGDLALQFYATKASWDTGNEISTRFDRPWVTQPAFAGKSHSFALAVDAVLSHEAELDEKLRAAYAALNSDVYRLYGVNDTLRDKIEAAIGERPPELVWPQMEGKERDQKRREHVERLLCYLVKKIVSADDDGLVCLQRVAHEPPLVERLRHELASFFPKQDASSVETEVVNELKKKTKGYQRTESLAEWLHHVFFEIHNALYQQRPILWHLASSQTRNEPGFACIVHAHRFDHDALAKLLSVHVRDRISTIRREAAHAGQDGKEGDRLDLLALAEEVEAFETKLKRLQEGAHSGPKGGDGDYRILTPWKSSAELPQGWNPDLDDGIKVNLAPLARTNLLRIQLRIGEQEAED